jgi:hypothetical protein
LDNFSCKYVNSKRQFSEGQEHNQQALAFGGFTTVNVAATEEWTGAGAGVTKTITVS